MSTGGRIRWRTMTGRCRAQTARLVPLVRVTAKLWGEVDRPLSILIQ
jgi:hypothetical protein